MLLAVSDGRALTATMLASEAGVAPSTASTHLAKLVGAGLLRVEAHGRHRHYRIAGPEVGDLIEALTHLAPPIPVRSLRDGTRAHAIRRARTCYDHLAGQLGTDLMAALLDRQLLTAADRIFCPQSRSGDPLAGPGRDHEYRLTPAGRAWIDDFKVTIAPSVRRPLIRYCVDWSEQRPHLAGALGAGLLTRLLELQWLQRSPTSRAVLLTDHGRSGLSRTLGLLILR